MIKTCKTCKHAKWYTINGKPSNKRPGECLWYDNKKHNFYLFPYMMKNEVERMGESLKSYGIWIDSEKECDTWEAVEFGEKS